MKLSVVGLGKLGSCSAACFAATGHEVIGIDINPRFVDAVNAGKAPVEEPRLPEMIARSGSRLRASLDFSEAMTHSDITFLIVPTPSLPNGNFSTEYLKAALVKLAESYRARSHRHLFVITSTVTPGSTERELIPFIEKHSGKVFRRDFDVCYNPEFIALGSVVADFLNPDMLLIGESSAEAGEKLAAVYRQTCENKPVYSRMSLVSAEIAKISLNAYVTMKISFANTLSNLAERIPGAEIDKITSALGADKRISPHYMRGGLAFGGPCFPRDNSAFVSFARANGVDAPLPLATDQVNCFQIANLFRAVSEYRRSGETVVVLGLSYKPSTPVIEESSSIKLIERLLAGAGNRIVVYDPLAMENARKVFGDRIGYAASLQDALNAGDVVVVTTLEKEFRGIGGSAAIKKGALVIDCWRVLNRKDIESSGRYVALGECSRGFR